MSESDSQNSLVEYMADEDKDSGNESMQMHLFIGIGLILLLVASLMFINYG